MHRINGNQNGIHIRFARSKQTSFFSPGFLYDQKMKKVGAVMFFKSNNRRKVKFEKKKTFSTYILHNCLLSEDHVVVQSELS